MSGEKSGYLRLDLKFLLGQVGFQNILYKRRKAIKMPEKLPVPIRASHEKNCKIQNHLLAKV